MFTLALSDDFAYSLNSFKINISHIMSYLKYCKDFSAKNPLAALEKYPEDTDGFAIGLDPFTQGPLIKATFNALGFVVVKNCVSIETIDYAISRLSTLKKLSALTDSANTPLMSRGFLDVYHDNSLCQIRQSIGLYLANCLIWDTPYLWTSFDRFGIKPPKGESSNGLGLHVDQNYKVHPNFTTLQGVLALTDSKKENSTFQIVPKSFKYFSEYASLIPNEYKGEFVNLPTASFLYSKLSPLLQTIALKKGYYVIWDSRCTHSNSSNISNEDRLVAYVAMGPENSNTPELINARMSALDGNYGINLRDAYLHASKKPRFSDTETLTALKHAEEFSILGLLLYGILSWTHLK